MIKNRFLAAGVALLVLAGGVNAATRDVPETAPGYITDAHGRAIITHGFSTDGGAKQSADGLPSITEADVTAEHADMGTNFVRLLISWRAVEPEPGVYDEEYFDGLEEIVDWYAERDYAVMLDMHQDLWGMGLFGEDNVPVGNGAPDWATYTDGKAIKERSQWELHYLDPGVVRSFDNFWNTTGSHPELLDHYADAWGAVAGRFANQPAVVAYDLMNESYGGSAQGPPFEAGVLTELYQRATDRIRETDSDAWVCIEPQVIGYNWGLPSALTPLNDPEGKVAFCPHIYPHPLDLGNDYIGADRDMTDKVISGWTANTLSASQRLGGAPIILGEFGLNTERPGALDYVETVLSEMGRAGIGTAYWSRDDGPWGPYDSDKQPRNLVDVLNRPYPRAVAGTPLRWEIGDDGALTLEMIPDPELEVPTVFYLPPEEFSQPRVNGGEVLSWDPDTGLLEVEAAAPSNGEGVVEVTVMGQPD